MLLKLLPLIGCLVGVIDGYCTGIGANPSFLGPPKVEQVNLTAVLVSWDGLVQRVDCADQFLVKSALVSSPNEWSMTHQLPTTTFSVVITDRIPELEYFYKVIAREDKGWRGIEYNRSPERYFKTSRKKKDMTNAKIQDLIRGPDVDNKEKEDTEEESLTPEKGEDGGVSSQSPAPRSADQSADQSTPRTGPIRTKEEDTNWVKNYLVWIIVGSLAVVIILIGVIYNIRKKLKPAGSIQLDIEIDSSVDSDEEEGSEHGDSDVEANKEFEKLKMEDDDLNKIEEAKPLNSSDNSENNK